MELEDTVESTLKRFQYQNKEQEKRNDYIDWTDYFMAMAFLAAKRSKDPSFQVGACIVNKENVIVGIGYNGMPRGCDDDVFPWGKDSPSPLNNKLLYVCHAEMNAITNKNMGDIKGCTIYVGLFPCNECAKIIIQSGIKEVVYVSDKKSHKSKYIASKIMFKAAGVKYWQYIPKNKIIEINFLENDEDLDTSNTTVNQDIENSFNSMKLSD